jgi:hypothetical protein
MVMQYLLIAAVLLAGANSSRRAPPTVITTCGDWAPLLRELGVDPIEPPEPRRDAEADIAGLDAEWQDARVLFYDPRQDRIADRFTRERLAGQGVMVVELRDSPRCGDLQRRRTAAVRIHAALVRAMPEKKLDLDGRLRDLLRRLGPDSASLGPWYAGATATSVDARRAPAENEKTKSRLELVASSRRP